MQQDDLLDKAIRDALNEEAQEIPVPNIKQAYGRFQMRISNQRARLRNQIMLRNAAAILAVIGVITWFSPPGYALFGWEQKVESFKEFIGITTNSKGQNLPPLEHQVILHPDMSELVSELPYQPGFPALLPSGFRLLDTTINATAHPIVQLRLRYGEPSGGDLIITQVNVTANSGGGEAFPGAQAKNVKVGKLDGVILTQEDGKHRLVFNRDNVRFTLVSSLDEEMLTAIAKSIDQ